MTMIENGVTLLTVNSAGVFFVDFYKPFDCIGNDLLIAKLRTYGFDTDALKFIYSYHQKQKTRDSWFITAFLLKYTLVNLKNLFLGH